MPQVLNAMVNGQGFSAWERDWIQYLLGDFQVNFRYDPEHDLVMPNPILVLSVAKPGQSEAIIRHIEACKTRGFHPGVIHTSDEWEECPLDFYDHAAFVFRNYYRSTLADRINCHFFAIGYRSGIKPHLRPRPISLRKLRWSFAGSLKNSRFAMMEAATKIPGGAHFITRAFNDPQGLSPAQYAAMLNDSVFVLCARGYRSLDTFRLYEAMEAGCIPIVEDPAHDDRSMTVPPAAQSYWTNAYGSEFPCPRIAAWENLATIMAAIDIEQTAYRIARWWEAYKTTLRAQWTKTITSTLK